MNLTRLAAMLTTVAALCGCDDLQLGGRLDNGEFDYECGSPGDAACEGSDEITGFDLDREVIPIAVGGNFGFSFDDDLAVRPATADIIDDNGNNTFVFTAPGTVDFVAYNGEGQVVDFVDLTGRTIDGVAIFQDGAATDTVQVDTRGSLIAAAPVANGEPLAGGFAYTWTITGNASYESALANTSNAVEVELTSSSSTATATVEMGGFSATVKLVPD